MRVVNWRSPLACLFAACWAAGAVAGEPAGKVDYDRDVRPILSDRCFLCHGPDAESRQADLRLDTHAGLTDYVVVPGKPDESELIARVTSDDETYRMPPPDSNLSLSDDERELLRRWIAEGAEFTEHWAFTPLAGEIDVPAVRDGDWPRGALDRFVAARLEAEGLRPSPQAEPLRLLRRVTLDLTGLPPTPAEIREFKKAAADNLEAALEQAVDRLLASEAFGEHMAVSWLDAGRYADSFGYQSDQLNTQWPYRDWVVRALNANMPYDEFITLQLAGDLLPNAGRDQILATAFNRLHRLTNEGGSLSEEWLVENAADRLHTFGTAMLGLTLECARCHDHKYDPISQRDYYSLFAFFNSIDENGMYDHAAKVPSPTLMMPTPEEEEALAAARQKVAETEAALAAAIADGEGRFRAWLANRPSSDLWVDDVSDVTAYFTFDDDGESVPNLAPGAKGEAKLNDLPLVPSAHGKAVRFDGDNGVVISDIFKVDRWDAFTLDFMIRDNAQNALPVVVAQRTYGTDVGYNGFDIMLADGILDVRLYRVWPGNAIGVRSLEPLPRGQWQRVTVTYDGSSSAAGLRLYIGGKQAQTRTLRDRIQKSAAVATHGDGNLTLGQRFRDRGFKDGELDELRVYSRALTPLEIERLCADESSGVPGAEAAADAPDQHLGISGPSLDALPQPPIDSRSPINALKEFYFSAVDAEVRALADELREARRRFVEVEDAVHEVAVMEELPEPRPAHVLARGEYDAPKTSENRVERDTFQSILIPLPDDAPRDRLGLARWMTDPRHPLTARVFVNNVWTNFFGRGLVETPENFGRQGESPTHRTLLDWLARDFIEHGWDIKRLCRQIVLSATYRQDSRRRPELSERDPENRLLARGPSHRLSAEQIRDVALAASGLLEGKLGGPPVSPYQPGEDLWREANDMSPPYRQSTGKALYRRSLYSVWKRTAPLPNMTAFDAPTREVCTVSRSRTNTPLQAMVLLNDVQFVEAARTLAEVVAGEHSETSGQIREAFLRLAGRYPDAEELELLTAAYKEQRDIFERPDGKEKAVQYLQVGESEPGMDHPAQLAALTATCQIIMNLDATVYKR